MNQKTQRFATIRKIIRNELISSQEELIARLRECGVEITQSTLSRDLKFMNVAKVPHKDKGYIYVLPNTVQHDANVSSNISDNITSLTFSGNLGVLKTKSGYASAISVPIDNLDSPDILGTIAGDNTVLLILREDANRGQIIESLVRIFPMINNILTKQAGRPTKIDRPAYLFFYSYLPSIISLVKYGDCQNHSSSDTRRMDQPIEFV